MTAQLEALTLYSFRRCPYAIRARMTLRYCGFEWEHREVVLKDKPPELLAASKKGTVPVLLVEDRVLEESLEIMDWALSRSDPEGWVSEDEVTRRSVQELVAANDTEFKLALDRYKYSATQESAEALAARRDCEEFLAHLEGAIGDTGYLLNDRRNYADVALLPFVRQFANVEPGWFQTLELPRLHGWLNQALSSPLFLSVMQKYPQWRPEPSGAGNV